MLIVCRRAACGCGNLGIVTHVPFNRASTAPKQREYLAEAFASGHVSGDGPFTARAATTLADWIGASDVLMTPSCTDALEMCALLLGIEPGDEVIVPSFTFVSTANAFALFGAQIVFADVQPGTMNIDPDSVRGLLTARTRAIVVVHYGGVGCDMPSLLALSAASGVPLIEDNAHGLRGALDGAALGSFAPLATLSFHETKNFSCGEGGALVINDIATRDRAEILREKGTNRSQFFRGAVDKYTWVDLGSSYLLSDPLAAVLQAQVEDVDAIQERRHAAWRAYDTTLGSWATDAGVDLPSIPSGVEHPAHLYWMLMPDLATRTAFIAHMRERDVHAVFHYQALNVSPMGMSFGGEVGTCPVAEMASDRLVRLPVFSDMRRAEYEQVIEATLSFRGVAT